MNTTDLQTFKSIARSQIDKLNKQLEELRSKKEDVAHRIKPEIHEKLEQLQEDKEELVQRYESFKDATDINWDIVRESFENTAASIREGVEELQEVLF